MAKTYLPPPPPVTIEGAIEPGRVFVIRAMPPPYMLESWSKQLPPTDRVFRSDTHFSHVHGNRSETYLLEYETDPITGEMKDLIAPLEAARGLTRRMIGSSHKQFNSPGWTYSALARTINSWLDIRQVSFQREKMLSTDWAYQLCWPGVYPHLTLYDMTAAYWQIWQRAASPRFVIIGDRKIIWQPLADDENTRWKKMLRLLGDPTKHKPLKLKIVGVNLVGWKGKHGSHELNTKQTIAWQGGEKITIAGQPGALLPLALLAVRCTFELCQVQSELVNSVYSNSDCVVTESREPMRYWDELKINYRKKAEGVSIIRGVGAWAIGDKQTLDFSAAQAALRMNRHKPSRLENPYLHRLVLEDK